MHRSPAFTLIESMVAIVILGTMLFSAMVLVVQVHDSVEVNKRFITGTYLLQECQELVRNLRDSMWKQNLRWNCAFDSDPNTAYAIANRDISAVGGATPHCLDGTLGGGAYLESDQRVYLKAYPSGASNPEEPFALEVAGGEVYYRAVDFDYSDDRDSGCNSGVDLEVCTEVQATCKVWWDEIRNNRRQLELTQILTNWQKP